jgi:hypothetical protein
MQPWSMPGILKPDRKAKQGSEPMIGLIVPANLKYAPYVQQYLRCCQKEGVETEIISWNKFGMEEESAHVFQCRVQTSKRDLFYGIGRFFTWVRFAGFAKGICKKKKYDKLILFTAQLGVFLEPFLVKQYPGKYLLDIRDDSPIVHLLQNRLNQVVNHAAEIVVSSPDFDFWESDRKGCLCHNAEEDAAANALDSQPRPWSKGRYRIISMGDLGGFELNRRLVEALGNDRRFSLLYIGRGNIEKNKLEEFSRTRGFDRVTFCGSYEKKDVYETYQKHGDFVNIIREKNRFNHYALPNKLYEGTIAGLPVITLKGNLSLTRMVRQYSLGIVLDEMPESGLGDVLEKSIESMDFIAYCQGRQEFLKMLTRDQKLFQSMLKSFIAG